MTSDWASRPRTLPPTGRRKSTATYCLTCEAWHPTARAIGGAAVCPAMAQVRAERRETLFAGPHISMPPRKAEKVVVTGG